MSEYLAIDPGEHAGWAIMAELANGLTLTACGINKAPRRLFKTVLYEKPNIYPGDSPYKRECILTLCVTSGELIAPFREMGAKIVYVNPRTWKGGIPKHVHHPAILDKLSPAEQSVVAQCGKGISLKFIEDMMDAVGLAAYARKMHIFGK